MFKSYRNAQIELQPYPIPLRVGHRLNVLRWLEHLVLYPNADERSFFFMT